MRSMTGFGIGSAPFGSGKLCVELKSVNHRYLDIRVRVPPEFADHSFYLENLARSRLVRGRIDLQLRTEGQTAPVPQLDVERARIFYRQLVALRDDLAPNEAVSVSALLGLPSLFVESDEYRADRVREAINAAFVTAHQRLEEMREREGAHQATVLRDLVMRASELTKRCGERACESIKLHRGRLRERVVRILDDPQVVVDPGRLEQEVALLADRADVSEELARLSCHYEQLLLLIASNEPAGRRMDFLLQEINRETNTLGAKSQDATLSHLVVELKAESERMREQVQNVE